MTRRRKVMQGSFGAHLEEVVKHFPTDEREPASERPKRDAESFREARDIHTLLFERAWQLDQTNSRRESP